MATHELSPAPTNGPRPPNVDELRQLADYLCDLGEDRDNAIATAQDASVAVFDHYMTDCPGYAGKLMSVIWSGSPSFFEVFFWEKGTMVRSERDYDPTECVRCGRKNSTLCWQCWHSTT